MSRIGVSITKQTAFRDAIQEFGNTYYYENVGLLPDAALCESIVDYIVAAERPMHAAVVTFVRARVWSAGGGPADNEMLFEKPLTGPGTSTAQLNIDRERAILVQWPAGKDSRGRPVFLRKWYHSCGTFGGVTFTQAQIENTTKLSDTQRGQIVGYANDLSRVPVTSSFGLVSANGRVRDGGLLGAVDPVAHPYLEHNQLGDQWRA